MRLLGTSVTTTCKGKKEKVDREEESNGGTSLGIHLFLSRIELAS